MKMTAEELKTFYDNVFAEEFQPIEGWPEPTAEELTKFSVCKLIFVLIVQYRLPINENDLPDVVEFAIRELLFQHNVKSLQEFWEKGDQHERRHR